MLSLLFSCENESPNNSSKNEITRPHDPWVFRSVLDKIPRVITFALHDKCWVAYSTANASLYKVWRGSVNFEGPVYDMAHGPQPTSVGDAYMVKDLNPAWLWMRNGDAIDYEVSYLGHRFENGEAWMNYALVNGSDKIEISESPGASESENGQLVFERLFDVKGLKIGDKLLLEEEVTSVVVKEHVESSGTLNVLSQEIQEFGNKKFEKPTTQMVITEDGQCSLTIWFTEATLLDPNLEEEFTADAPTGAQLISKHGCRTCHNVNLKTVGPAYKAIAERYENNDENKAMLVAKVKAGGSGTWGNQVMNAHPEISDIDLKDMVKYILSLDADTEKTSEEQVAIAIEPSEVGKDNLVPGSVVRIYNVPSSTNKIPSNLDSKQAVMAGVLPNFGNLSDGDFSDLKENFALTGIGYFEVEEDGIYDMRVWSDDGSKVKLGNQWILDHDGPHGTSMKEVKLSLKKGLYPFRLEFYQGMGGKFLSWNYKPESAEKWMVIPSSLLMHDKNDHDKIGTLSLPMASRTAIPGDRYSLDEVHPSFDLFQARPDDFTPKVGGMDFLSDGSLLISTWEPDGGVYKLSNIRADDPNKIKVDKIASGLAEPLGLKVVDDRIFIMQKQEMTELIDHNGDGLIDEYRTLADDWGVSANFHEFGFGLEEQDGFLYAALATAIEPGGASTQPQIKDRGKVIKVNINTGELEFIAHGLRTPNGVGKGYKGELFVSDNEGDWLPSSKINHIQEGVWFGGRSVDFEGTAELEMTHPLVWLPQNEVGNSPSTPSYLNIGPYKDQMIHGEVTNGGVKRVFVEEVDGKLQGCVFRFIQGLEAGVNRVQWASNDELFIGGIGNSGNWQHDGKKWYGIQRLKYNSEPVFEMLAVRAKSNGLEIEFTQSLKANEGWNPEDYEIKRWWYKPTVEYGGPKMDETVLKAKSANVSADRKKVFLEFDGLKDHHLFYVRLKNKFISENNLSLWSTEAWYTMNAVPENDKGKVATAPDQIAANSLSDHEKAEGWKLLFDGKSMNGWKNFKKDGVGKSWVIDNGTMHLNSTQNEDGTWSAKDGGDIITIGTYENFELNLEWKISNCGNSGIMYNVQEDEKYCCPWWTGPEMQILDNACHPDTKYPTHRAGDLYDMIETKYVTTHPAGEWNKVRLISNNSEVQFWLNGYKVVEFTMFDDNWVEMIDKSKFTEMGGFGEFKNGHIALQDHSDKVWFRNIKIKEL